MRRPLPLRVSIALAHLAAASGFVVYALIEKRMAVASFVFFQILAGTLYLCLVHYLSFSAATDWNIIRQSRNAILAVGIPFGVLLAFYFYFFFYSIKSSSATNTAVLLSLQPILTIVFIWMFLSAPGYVKRPALVVMGVALSLFGSALYAGLVDFSRDSIFSPVQVSRFDAYALCAVAAGTAKALVVQKLSNSVKARFPVLPGASNDPNLHARNLVSSASLTFGFIVAAVFSFLVIVGYALVIPLSASNSLLQILVLVVLVSYLGIVPVSFVERVNQRAQDEGHAVLAFGSRQIIPILILLSSWVLSIALPARLGMWNFIGAAGMIAGAILTVVGRGEPPK